MALVQRYHSIDALYAAMPTPEMAPGTPAKPGVVKSWRRGRRWPGCPMTWPPSTPTPQSEFDPEQNLCREADNDALYQLFLDLEFAKLIDKYGLHRAPGREEKRRGDVRRFPASARRWTAGTGWRSFWLFGGSGTG